MRFEEKNDFFRRSSSGPRPNRAVLGTLNAKVRFLKIPVFAPLVSTMVILDEQLMVMCVNLKPLLDRYCGPE